MMKFNYLKTEKKVASFLESNFRKERTHPSSESLKARITCRLESWQYRVGFTLRNLVIIMVLLLFLAYGTFLLIQVIQDIQQL